MYRLYKELCDKRGTSSAKEATYKAVVYTDFNIAFQKPKKGLCEECQAFENLPDPTDEQKEKQEVHLRYKDRARNYKDELKSKAKGAPHVSSACFDLQQALPCPRGQSSRFFL